MIKPKILVTGATGRTGVPPTPRLALDDADWKASHGSEGSAVVGGPLKEVRRYREFHSRERQRLMFPEPMARSGAQLA